MVPARSLMVLACFSKAFTIMSLKMMFRLPAISFKLECLILRTAAPMLAAVAIMLLLILSIRRVPLVGGVPTLGRLSDSAGVKSPVSIEADLSRLRAQHIPMP